MRITRQEMINELTKLGLSEAIADKNAMANGYKAIFLRWNGMEEYYTGYDQNSEYISWLQENFKD